MRKFVGPRCPVRFLIPLVVLFPAAPRVCAEDLHQLVRDVVWNEIHAEANDHSHWMYRDAYKSPEKNTVKLVIQTSEVNFSEMIEDHGQPPTEQEHQDDMARVQQLLTDPGARARLRRNEAHDGQQADDLMKMLPTAFIWTFVSSADGRTTLAYRPDPNFQSPSMSSKVLSSMSGTLVVDDADKRLISITGKLLKGVQFGWGILGHLNAGGTFQIIREQIAPGEWQITQMHVHISGHALFFRTIGDQEDEGTTDYRPVPADVDMQKAAEMVRDGQLARELGVDAHFGH
jgi:hypothetical protein